VVVQSAAETTSVPWALSPGDRDQPAARVFALLLEQLLADFTRREAAVRSGADAVRSGADAVRSGADAVRSGADAEVLHKYRVVIRRTRSLLAAGATVFPDEELELLAAMLARLAALTSPVRDLDVLLGDFDDRVDAVGAVLGDGRGELRAALESQRSRDRDELFAALDGQFSTVLLRRWHSMASVYRLGGAEPGPDALRPAGEVADEVLWATFRRLRTLGRRARASEHDTDWHRLRKRLKRFRYVLMAFEDMYPPGTLSRVLGDLADLQDGLGELQDHAVRVQIIRDAGVGAGGHAALLAGALVDRLCVETPDARRACERSWDAFDRPKVRRHLRGALVPAGGD